MADGTRSVHATFVEFVLASSTTASAESTYFVTSFGRACTVRAPLVETDLALTVFGALEAVTPLPMVSRSLFDGRRIALGSGTGVGAASGATGSVEGRTAGVGWLGTLSSFGSAACE